MLFLFKALSLSLALVQWKRQILCSCQSDVSYAAMVDCGGSGSRGRIYYWQSNSESTPYEVEALKNPDTGKALSLKIQPGLSSVQENPERAADYLQPMMEFFNQHVPLENQHETHIYFLATSGLRSLPQSKQKAIMDNIRETFSAKYPNFARIHAEIISGQQEGMYQWLSVNSLTNRLRNHSLGIIEVGSGSVQVAYELEPKLELFYSKRLKFKPEALAAFKHSQRTITLSNQSSIHLFTLSFPSFGTEAARRLQVELMLHNTPRSWRIPKLKDPCLPLGLEEQTKYNGTEVTLVGAGKYVKCQSMLNKVLYVTKQEELNRQPCANENQSDTCSLALLGLPFVPFKWHKFLGLSDLYYTTHEMANASGAFNEPLLRAKAAQICSTPHQILLLQYPEANRVDKSRTAMECFKLLWLFTLLNVGLLLPPEGGHVYLETVNELNGNEIDWTRGALLERLLTGSNESNL